MSTKDKLLKLFEENKGTYLSGEEIADKLDISRTAVWKAVNSLKDSGYPIDSQKNRGYCLSPMTDIVSASGIGKYLSTGLTVEVYDEVVSTNTMLKERASQGAKEGLVIIANSQTGGKGRLGRQFYSPLDTGVYISVLLRPVTLPPQEALKVTTMAAVAASEAVDAVSGRESKIKWVNDIYLDGLKVAGILTEASVSMESGHLEYAVLGIGFNVYEPKGGFPDDIKGIAGAILPESAADAKNRIAAEFLNRFFKIYSAPEGSDYSGRYKERSLVTGKKVNVITPVGSSKATVLDITDDCSLLVRYEDGTVKELSTGEVSIRPE